MAGDLFGIALYFHAGNIMSPKPQFVKTAYSNMS